MMSFKTKRDSRSLNWTHVMAGALLMVLMSACATNPSPDPGGPSSTEPSYPILLDDNNSERRDAALANWVTLTRDQGISDAEVPEFQAVTATLRSLPKSLPRPLLLPRVGDSAPMNEEELREALRRFISDAGPLLCGDPQQLSLIQRIDGADGVKQAVYQQRAFRSRLRGGYGELRISFMADRRITGLSSTCLPETERIRRGFTGLGQQRMPVEKIIEGLPGRIVTYINSDGGQQNYTISAKDRISARELVIYPVQRPGEPPVIEIHVAWEIIVESENGMTIYVDSIMGDILAAERGLHT